MEEKLQSYLSNFASYFKKSKSHSIGIDIGSNSIKIVELQKRNNQIELKNYALVKINQDLSKEDVKKYSGKLVKKILEQMSIKGKTINLSLPSYSSLITLIEVPGENEEEIAREIEFEASKYIPVDLNEVVFDWQIIENREGDKYREKKQELSDDMSVQQEDEPKLKLNKVVLVSVMKDISGAYQKSFSENDLDINLIEVDCFSIQRAFVADKEKNYLILDIGSKVTNIIGSYKGQMLFNRNIDLAGDKITDLISKSLNVSKERAEIMKKEQGFESDSKSVVENILKPAFSSIFKKAFESLEEFDEFKNFNIDKIVLTGGSSSIKGLREFVSEEFGKEVVFGNPWSEIKYPPKIEKDLLFHGPFFAVAIGLAFSDLK